MKCTACGRPVKDAGLCVTCWDAEVVGVRKPRLSDEDEVRRARAATYQRAYYAAHKPKLLTARRVQRERDALSCRLADCDAVRTAGQLQCAAGHSQHGRPRALTIEERIAALHRAGLGIVANLWAEEHDVAVTLWRDGLVVASGVGLGLGAALAAAQAKVQAKVQA